MVTGKEVVASSKYLSSRTIFCRHSFISVFFFLLFYWLEHLWNFAEKFWNFGLPYMYIRSALVPQDRQASVASQSSLSIVSSILCSAPSQPLVLPLVIAHCIVL